MVTRNWFGIRGRMGVLNVYHELHSNNWINRGMCLTRIVCIGCGAIDTIAYINRRRFNWSSNSVWKYLGPKIDRKNIKPIHFGHFAKLGILGYDMGRGWNVFKCPITDDNIYRHGTI